MKSAHMTITEKIDGTNAQILIEQDGGELKVTCVGSRKRQIFPNGTQLGPPDVPPCKGRDNAGFAAWVAENEVGLVQFLGEGRHYGEWAGPGIQKNPLGLTEKYFFVFNTHRNPPEKFEALGHLVPNLRAVPILFEGPFDMHTIDMTMRQLIMTGSAVAEANKGPDCKDPEGIIISCFGQKFKRTPVDYPKGLRE